MDAIPSSAKLQASNNSGPNGGGRPPKMPLQVSEPSKSSSSKSCLASLFRSAKSLSHCAQFGFGVGVKLGVGGIVGVNVFVGIGVGVSVKVGVSVAGMVGVLVGGVGIGD